MTAQIAPKQREVRELHPVVCILFVLTFAVLVVFGSYWLSQKCARAVVRMDHAPWSFS